jgi:hypothetical protein
MSVLKPVVYDNSLQRQIARGDVLAGAEIIPATIATNAITITGAQLSAGFISRSPTGAATDTIDSAANILNAVNGGLNIGIQSGTTFRVRWLVSTAFATAVAATANTGVTVTNGAIAASSWKDFLVTVVNGTPAYTDTAFTTNASAVLTGMSLDDTSKLSVGMVVTNAVSGLQGATILSVQPGVGVTMSGNANATSGVKVAVSFSPVIKVDGIGQGLV